MPGTDRVDETGGTGRATGPVALVGSGEFLDVMVPVDAGLLEGRPRRAVIVPTAAALEGEERVAYWLELGRRHYESMGVEPVALDVRTRRDAEDPATAALVEGAGLLYLSGGDPHHLSDTLRGYRAVARHRGGLARGGGPRRAARRGPWQSPRVLPTGSSPPEAHHGGHRSIPASPTGSA